MDGDEGGVGPAHGARARHRAPSGPTGRRTVLRGAASGALLVLGSAAVGVTAAGCARPEGPDELEAALARARADAALAAASAARFAGLGDRLAPVAQARRTHADVLAAEIRRARPDRAEAIDAAPAPTASPPPAADAALDAVREALAAAGTEGRALALRAEPYRCGLLASVAAGCAGHETALGTA